MLTDEGVLYPIKNPKTIFARQREALAALRDPGKRYNSMVKGPTPKVNTAEMKEHMQKHRTEEADLLEKGQIRMNELRLERHVKYKALMKAADKMAKENKKDMQQINFE